MKTKRNVLILLVGMVFLASCTYNIGLVKTTYKMLSASQISYDTGMKIAADLYNKGRITDREKQTIISIGTTYVSAHNAAVEALARYEETKSLEDQNLMTAQIEIATNTLAELLALIRPYITEE